MNELLIVMYRVIIRWYYSMPRIAFHTGASFHEIPPVQLKNHDLVILPPRPFYRFIYTGGLAVNE